MRLLHHLALLLVAATAAAAAAATVAPAEEGAVPTGWEPVDVHRIKRHTALGLFGGPGASAPTLHATQGAVTKDGRNPVLREDRPWETRLDNGYPNVVYDPAHTSAPWRLWYGNLGPGGQYLLYANSSDGIRWDKPDLGRYDLREKWGSSPAVAKLGKHNNIVMFGGGLGIYRDLHEPNPALRYKISGGSPAGCYSDDGSRNCIVGTAGSPDGIGGWGDVSVLGFPAPWQADCHTNIIWDNTLGKYLMTTRDYEPPQGREIGIARTGHPDVFRKNGTRTLMYSGEYPVALDDRTCFTPSGGLDDPVGACSHECLLSEKCRYFWVYTKASQKGICCLKTAVVPGPMGKPNHPECAGEFYSMGGKFVPSQEKLGFDTWLPPVRTMRGTAQHQLYSQITWRFYDIFLGIVMTFDAEDLAGHVHCMLSWSADSVTWQWVDSEGGLDALKEFIPAGHAGDFDSHICFAAHLPLRMPDGSSRIYYMGGNGPHDGKRDTSLGLVSMQPDRFVGVTAVNGGVGPVSAISVPVKIAEPRMIVSVDVEPGGSFQVEIPGTVPLARSRPITSSGTDVEVDFPAYRSLEPLLGQVRKLEVHMEWASFYTLGFAPLP